MLPASKWKLVRPIVEEATCDPLLSTTLSATEWEEVEEKKTHFFPRYLTPQGEWSTMLPLDHSQWEYQRYCHLCSKVGTSGHMMTEVHNRNINDWKRRGCPPVHIAADRFTDNQRLEMVLQAFLPSFTREQILATKERILQEEWYHSSGRYEGPVPDEGTEVEVMVVSSSAAPSTGPSSSAGPATEALTRPGGIWTEPPPPPKSRPGGSWTKPPPPPPEEQPKKKARGRTSGKPWPDTYGVALRSSALLENAAPLRPLTPRSASPQKISSSDSDEQWGVWKATGARHKDTSGSQRPKTPPKSSAASVEPEAAAMEDRGARAPQTPPKLSVLLRHHARLRSHLYHHHA